MTLSPADIDRWDPAAINAVFAAAIARANGTRTASAAIGEAMTFLDWDGQTAEAARAAVGRTMVDLDNHADACGSVGRAAQAAAEEVAGIKSRLTQIRTTAGIYHLRIDEQTGAVSLPADLAAYSAADQREIRDAQPRVAAAIKQLSNDAEVADEDLAAAIRGADGELSPQQVATEVAAHYGADGGAGGSPDTGKPADALGDGADGGAGGLPDAGGAAPPGGEVINADGSPVSDLPFPFDDGAAVGDGPTIGGDVINADGSPASDLPFPFGPTDDSLPVGGLPFPLAPTMSGDAVGRGLIPPGLVDGASKTGDVLGATEKGLGQYADAVTDHGRHWTPAAAASNAEYVAGLKKFGRGLGVPGNVLNFGAEGYEVWSGNESFGEAGAKIAGGWAGMETGAEVFGAVGLAVGGPVGGFVGGLAGGLAGAFFGESVAEHAVDWLTK